MTTKQRLTATGKCARCRTTKNLTADHIIPLAVLRAMGIPCTDSRNLQRLCKTCNNIKGSQLDPKNSKTRTLMEYYIQRWSDLYQVKQSRRQYVFRTLTVKSLTPEIYYFVEAKKALQSIYQKQIGL